MGRSVSVTTRPDPDAPGTGRARPGEPRRTLCRYLRRGTAGQCTAEAVDPEADVLLCGRHTALTVEFYNNAIQQLTDPAA